MCAYIYIYIHVQADRLEQTFKYRFTSSINCKSMQLKTMNRLLRLQFLEKHGKLMMRIILAIGTELLVVYIYIYIESSSTFEQP